MRLLVKARRSDLRHGVLEVPGPHARGAHAADLLLVGQDAAAGVLGGVGDAEHGLDLRVGADPIVVAVADDHAAVQAEVPALARGDHLDLGGEEVLLLHAVLLLQDGQDGGLHGLLVHVLLGLTAYDHVQGLALNDHAGLLIHLGGGKMDEQIGDTHHGIVLIFADDHVHHGAVLLGHHAVEGQGQRHPLILLDAAVVVGIEIGKIRILIEGVLLQVHPGAVDVGAHDVEALLQRLAADDVQLDRLVHGVHVHPVPGLQGFDLLQVHVPGLLRPADGLPGAFPLGLAAVQIGPIGLAQVHDLFLFPLLVGGPRVDPFHR